MKQLAFHDFVQSRKQHKKTKKNIALFKQCFRDVYKMGMVSDETMQKVESYESA